MIFCKCLTVPKKWDHTKIVIWQPRRLTWLSRQKDRDQFFSSGQHLWMHQCWAEDRQKFVPWWSPNHRQRCRTVCTQGKPQNWSVCHGAKGKTKKVEKDHPSPKNPREYFPLFPKQMRAVSFGWRPISSTEMLAEAGSSNKNPTPRQVHVPATGERCPPRTAGTARQTTASERSRSLGY